MIKGGGTDMNLTFRLVGDDFVARSIRRANGWLGANEDLMVLAFFTVIVVGVALVVVSRLL